MLPANFFLDLKQSKYFSPYFSPYGLHRHARAKRRREKRKKNCFHSGSNRGSFACEANGLTNFPMEAIRFDNCEGPPRLIVPTAQWPPFPPAPPPAKLVLHGGPLDQRVHALVREAAPGRRGVSRSNGYALLCLWPLPSCSLMRGHMCVPGRCRPRVLVPRSGVVT